MNAPGRPVQSTALSLSHLNAYYGKLQILFDVSLDISPGETLGLLGRNGAGKTTTLLAIAGSVAHRADSIRIDGVEVGRSSVHARIHTGIALVPSGARVFPNLSVYENLLVVQGDGSRSSRCWTVQQVYDAFPKLKVLSNQMAAALSGGERQMLAISRAMRTGPTVLMMDEPSEGVAPLVMHQIGEIIKELNSTGVAILLAEQNHRFALAAASRACFLEKGQIAWHGSSQLAAESTLIHRYLAI